MIKTFKELDIWKKGIDLAEMIYRLTANFPSEEKYGLVSQLRRAAVSFPSNIAEGSARNSNKEFIQFLHISLGSLAELETQLIIAQRIGYKLTEENVFPVIEETRRKTLNFLKYQKTKL